jgi:RNA polymerase sigma-70 factor (ECF subfamily)
MSGLPNTQPSLLVRLGDGKDAEAWTCFAQVYGPAIYGFARKQGLQDADAADVLQEVLRVVAGAIPGFNYDPHRGTFRAWLFTVVRNQLLRFRSRQERPGQGTGSTSVLDRLHETPSPEEGTAELWDLEYERSRFAWAAEQVRPQVKPATWQAFWMTAVEGRSGEETALALGMTVAAVYLAKSRVMARLKEQIREALGD